MISAAATSRPVDRRPSNAETGGRNVRRDRPAFISAVAVLRGRGRDQNAAGIDLLTPFKVWIRDCSIADDRLSLGLVADVTDYAAVAAPSRRSADFGRCDHVVFAVGVGSGKFGFPFWNLEPADWEPVLRVNLIGAVNVAHACAPPWRREAAEPGRCCSSRRSPARSARRPTPLSAAKAGLINFAQCAAKDLAPRRAGQHALPGHG